jgi:hypothetical protein
MFSVLVTLLEVLRLRHIAAAGSVTVEAGDKAKASWVDTFAKNAPHFLCSPTCPCAAAAAGSVTVEAGDKAKASWVGAYSKNAPNNDQPGAPNNVRSAAGTNYAIAGEHRIAPGAVLPYLCQHVSIVPLGPAAALYCLTCVNLYLLYRWALLWPYTALLVSTYFDCTAGPCCGLVLPTLFDCCLTA